MPFVRRWIGTCESLTARGAAACVVAGVVAGVAAGAGVEPASSPPAPIALRRSRLRFSRCSGISVNAGSLYWTVGRAWGSPGCGQLGS